ncbi:MAG: O-antigen ligase family protein [Candidatus Paceibacterota bacterium]
MAKKKDQTAKKSFLEYVIQTIAVGVFAVLPLLYFPGRAGSYITSKQYFLIGAVDLLIVLWTWLLLSDTRYRLSKKNMLFLLPLFLFLLSQTVSAIFGVAPATSFFSKIESGTGLILLYHVFLLACVVTSLLRVQQKKLLSYVLQANFFTSVVLATATFLTGEHGVWDIGSEMLNKSSGGAMMGNSLLAGAYFIFSIFLTAYLITQEKSRYRKWIYGLGILLIAVCPIFLNAAVFKNFTVTSVLGLVGQARIATASLVAGLLVALCVWCSLQKEKKGLRILGIAGLVLGVLVLTGVVYQIVKPGAPLQKFFIAESGNRITDWKTSIEGIKERPLLGWGYENSHVVYQKYFDPIVFDPGHGNEVWAIHPHNNTLEVLVNGGVVGLLLYVLVFFAVFAGIFQLYKKGVFDKNTTALLVGMLIAFVLQQQMIYESIVSYAMLFLVIAIIAGFSDTADEQRKYNHITTAGYAQSVAIVLIMIPAWLFGAVFPSNRFKELQRVAEAHSDQRAAMYGHLFRSVGSYAVNTDPEFYTDPLFFSYDSQKEAIKANPMYQKVASEELSALVSAVDPIWQKSHYNYHLSLSLLQLQNLRYYLTGDASLLLRADEYAKRAFALSPTDPQIYYFYAQTLAYEHNVNDAKVLLNKAVSLNGNYSSAVEYRKLLQ